MEVTRNEMVKRNAIRSQDSLGFVLDDRFEFASTSRTSRAAEAFASKLDSLPAGRGDLQFDLSLDHLFNPDGGGYNLPASSGPLADSIHSFIRQLTVYD